VTVDTPRVNGVNTPAATVPTVGSELAQIVLSVNAGVPLSRRYARRSIVWPTYVDSATIFAALSRGVGTIRMPVFADAPFELAVTLTEPAALAVSNPVVLTVAMVVSLELQTTFPLLAAVPSLRNTAANN
jgi:hypothetical protein